MKNAVLLFWALTFSAVAQAKASICPQALVEGLLELEEVDTHLHLSVWDHFTQDMDFGAYGPGETAHVRRGFESHPGGKIQRLFFIEGAGRQGNLLEQVARRVESARQPSMTGRQVGVAALTAASVVGMGVAIVFDQPQVATSLGMVGGLSWPWIIPTRAERENRADTQNYLRDFATHLRQLSALLDARQPGTGALHRILFQRVAGGPLWFTVAGKVDVRGNPQLIFCVQQYAEKGPPPEEQAMHEMRIRNPTMIP